MLYSNNMKTEDRIFYIALKLGLYSKEAFEALDMALKLLKRGQHCTTDLFLCRNEILNSMVHVNIDTGELEIHIMKWAFSVTSNPIRIFNEIKQMLKECHSESMSVDQVKKAKNAMIIAKEIDKKSHSSEYMKLAGIPWNNPFAMMKLKLVYDRYFIGCGRMSTLMMEHIQEEAKDALKEAWECAE